MCSNSTALVLEESAQIMGIKTTTDAALVAWTATCPPCCIVKLLWSCLWRGTRNDNCCKCNVKYRTNRSDREMCALWKGGPLFAGIFQSERTVPFDFVPEFPEILVIWKTPQLAWLQPMEVSLLWRCLWSMHRKSITTASVSAFAWQRDRYLGSHY